MYVNSEQCYTISQRTPDKDVRPSPYTLVYNYRALSSHQRQPTSDSVGYRIEIVYIRIQYTINHPTTLHTLCFTHNEIQFPTAARRWHFALQDVSHRQSCHLSTPSHPLVPPVWPYCCQAQCGLWLSLKWSIADLLTSRSFSNVSLPFAWITGHAIKTFQLASWKVFSMQCIQAMSFVINCHSFKTESLSSIVLKF